MAKLVLTDIANISGNPTTAETNINVNNALIETALENTLSRDGSTPNAMAAQLDMDSNRIINLGAPVNLDDGARLRDVDPNAMTALRTELISTTAGEGAGLVSLESGTTVQAAITTNITNIATNVTDISGLRYVPITTQTASYILVLGDDYSVVRMNVGTANNLTVPPNSSVAFPIGTQILIKQVGAGLTTIVEGSGVTVTTNSTLVLDGQQSVVALIKESTNGWLLAGEHG